MRIARWAADGGPAVAEGFVVDDRVIPFPDGLTVTVADVLAGGLNEVPQGRRVMHDGVEPELLQVARRLVRAAVRLGAHGCAHEPSSYLKKLWFDTVVHDPAALRHLVEVAGESRVLLGSDFPFDMGLDDPVAEIRSAGLPEEITRRILGENAEALLDARVRA